jgi:Tfp pilus assembly protein PilF
MKPEFSRGEPAPPAPEASPLKRKETGTSPADAPPPLTWRERVGERLAERPFLRLLALNPFFGGILMLLALGVLLFALALPKIWRVTPPGFQPVVRGSLVDLVQAWSLGREGRRQMEAGDYSAAARTYFTAWKNNLGKVELLRHALQAFVRAQASSTSALARQARDNTRWLLLLSATNQADLFLAAQVYDALGDSGTVRGLLEPLEENLPENLYGAMAKAAFDSNDTATFVRWWQRAGKQLQQDATLALYYAAWQAGWGPESERAAGLQKLRAAAEKLDQRVLANRLLLKVYRHRRDLEHYQATLARLESFHGDRLADYVDYWLMLQAADRDEEALRRARNYPYPPRNALEVAALAQAFVQLGDRSAARVLLERYSPTLGDGPAMITLPLWAALADVYIAARDWKALVQMGRNLRSLPRGNVSLSGFGWLVEGRGLMELGDRNSAARAFQQAIKAGFPTPGLSLEMAKILLQYHFPGPAYQLLKPLESRYEDNVRYWQALFEVAYALRRDEALLFKAARRAMDLDPDNPLRRINYAAALLISRQRPDEAARITLDFLTHHPRSVPARLNHAQALAQMGRSAEAEQLLRRISVTSPALRSSVALVWLQISVNREDARGVKAALERIDERLLFPTQKQWVASVRERFGPPKAKSS